MRPRRHESRKIRRSIGGLVKRIDIRVILALVGLAAILGIQIVRRPDALLSLPFSIAIAALIHRVASVPTDALGRLLNARPVAWVGTVSYSLYLWQQAFVFRDAPHSRFPLNLALALFVAVVSHYAIERPLLRIGRRASQRIKPL